MTGSVLTLLGAAATGGGGGGGGGGGLAVVISPDPLEYYYNGSSYTATAFSAVTGGLAPYTVEWFVPGDLNVLYVANDTLTVESVTGADADIYCNVTDANSDVATSNTITITLPA